MIKIAVRGGVGESKRFFRSYGSEWAHGRIWPDSTTRDRALSSFLRLYNRRRPHFAAGGRPPISRVQQVREQNSQRSVGRGRARRGRPTARLAWRA
jgi:transposase InsO family protein